MQPVFRHGARAVVASLAAVAALAGASSSLGDLSSRQQSLQQAIGAETSQIQAYRGRLADLQARLAGIESSLAIQRAVLLRVQSELSAARARLVLLQGDLVTDRRVLAAQLVAKYEAPSPDIVGVVLESRGFADLLERVDRIKLIAEHNATVVGRVASVRAEVAAQTARLTAAEVRQRRVTTAVLVERDQVASIKLTVLEREHALVGSRAHKQAELASVRHKLAVLQAQAAAAQTASFALAGSGSGGFTGGGFASHSGLYGFFPAPGTNYSVGQEPEIAARLDQLGKALQLHLIGLSGYRSPQHSVEVGGFADDPHTRGEASDTPGVEGVPEATLLRFGLTRPFPGPAEADHIQLA
jgi:peptidoglycan hydrolase CwlO-like protein